MGTDGASCFHTLTADSRDVAKEAWDAERFGMLCTKAETFADWKSVIEKLCHLSKQCDYQTEQVIKEFFARVSTFTDSAQLARARAP